MCEATKINYVEDKIFIVENFLIYGIRAGTTPQTCVLLTSKAATPIENVWQTSWRRNSSAFNWNEALLLYF